MKVLVTGATGFIGSALLRRLERTGLEVLACARSVPASSAGSGRVQWLERDLGFSGDPLEGVDDLDVVVHLAARVHVIDEKAGRPLEQYRRVNVGGSSRMARSAARRGAKRFVFISSIGVNGNRSSRPFTKDDPPCPAGAYAVSKFEAETELKTVAAETGLELVVIRPPLVYGPGAPGNFGRLLRAVRMGVPLPFAMVRNRRSLVARANLVDLISVCIGHPAASGRVFLVSDGQDVSTPELIRKMARAAGLPARLFPVPPRLLMLAAGACGKKADLERLVGSLEVDISDTCTTLGWRPPVSLDRGVSNAVHIRGGKAKVRVF
jgi:nucleoside-diphosphate-sugar epimerase